MLSLLVPFRSDQAERERNWRWVRSRLEAVVPDSEIVVGESPPGPFNPSAAVNAAASRAKGDIFCVHDADCAISESWYMDARERVGWSIPQGSRYLTRAATKKLTARSSGTGWPVEPVENETEFSVGGIVMMSCEAFFEVGGKDDRFQGWGPEDAAFALALWALNGAPNRFGGPLTHLWHPTGGDDQPWPNGADVLFRRYEQAADPDAMREVLAR